MPLIITSDNLRLAFIKAVRGKRHTHAVVEFEKNLDGNLRCLAEEIRTCSRPWGPYYRFTIFDPKQRIISVAPLGDRVAHHALMNVSEPVFEQFQIFDSYASRRGKGQFAALERARFAQKVGRRRAAVCSGLFQLLPHSTRFSSEFY
jgi:hypothetical protein